MNVSLTPHFQALVTELVTSGRYGNASEVIRDALRLLEERETRLQMLRAAVEEGVNSGPPEELERFEDLRQQARAYSEARRQQRQS